MSRVAYVAAFVIALIYPASASAQKVASGGSWPMTAGHTLAIANDGSLWAWGSNAHGQIGDGTTANRVVPVPVPGLSQVVAVAAGTSFSLAVTADGTVWAWGRNDLRQLGDGTTTNRLTPVAILTNATKVAAGESHGLAVKSDGSVWTWGHNAYGQVGNGTTATPTAPAPLTTLSGVAAVAGAPRSSVAVKSDGTVWAWGDNTYAQLGNGTTTSSLWPVAVNGITDGTSVAAGWCFVLVRRANGAVSGWGCNWHGSVGDGSTIDRLSPVSVLGLPAIEAVAAGFDHALALTTTGEVWSWGRKNEGQLGDGTVVPYSRASKAAIGGLSSVAGIAAGGYNSAAYTTTGVLFTWGDNQFGQIGDGTFINRATPTAITEANFAWKVATPTFTPAGSSGAVNEGPSVTISTATPNATIRYSTDGSTPTEAHPLVTGPVAVDQNMTLKARGFHTTLAASNIGSAVFSLTVQTPTITPSGGTYASAQTVSMSTTTGAR